MLTGRQVVKIDETSLEACGQIFDALATLESVAQRFATDALEERLTVIHSLDALVEKTRPLLLTALAHQGVFSFTGWPTSAVIDADDGSVYRIDDPSTIGVNIEGPVFSSPKIRTKDGTSLWIEDRDAVRKLARKIGR